MKPLALLCLLVYALVDPYDAPLLAENSDCVDRGLHRGEVTAAVTVDAEDGRRVCVRRGEARWEVVADIGVVGLGCPVAAVVS